MKRLLLLVLILPLLIATPAIGIIDDYMRGYHDATQHINEADYSSLSYDGLMAFLETDKTNELELGDDKCATYAGILIHNAQEVGIQADMVKLSYIHNDKHAIVCFPTTQGLLYIDPQDDLLVMDLLHYQGTVTLVSRRITGV
jgi:hypothetical protein